VNYLILAGQKKVVLTSSMANTSVSSPFLSAVPFISAIAKLF